MTVVAIAGMPIGSITRQKICPVGVTVDARGVEQVLRNAREEALEDVHGQRQL